ncbi:MAG: acyl-CoA dehydrogenase [Gemmatimonadota bacterium]|nr:acyl-CoA dehydrogenase [Gemmatimonadota bacterium]MDH3367370.1 acyl-CoA dehydrogenase [Gemmatimonadota bacterium]MDH3477961.1 acyl-CoA dehydrogenase [Gemmatimonadota bacterium]MDH3569776.1 acyl-CoA dehydrogenase [Gemmatimonadota bacterium]MDH5549760.1 acyl-CoA dehydrogenase [Gemmatimonadota bacterium]
MSDVMTTSGTPLTTLSEDEVMFRDAVRDFAEAEVRPRVDAMERAAKFDTALIPKFAELGLMGIDIPMELGGAGGSFFMCVLAVEELSAIDASTSVLVDVQNTLVNVPFLDWGSEALKQKYLPRLAAGTVGAYALSEAGSGSDAFALACRAERDGDAWVLNGAKLWITNGAEAEIYVVFATVDSTKGHKGITAFIVEREFPGFTVGKKEDKLGIRASSTTELVLENCRVPADNVLGEIGRGYKVAIETLNVGRIGIGAQMVGVARGALDATRRYVMERQQFGKPIGTFQAVQFQLAQAATELEAGRLMVYNAARLRDAKQPYMMEAAMAKLYTAQMAERVTSLCVELFGGYGYTKEYPVEKYYRDAKIGAIYEGTSNMQLQTIGKMLLG